MTDSESINPIPVGIDDGYAYTKIALPDGRVHAILSLVRVPIRHHLDPPSAPTCL